MSFIFYNFIVLEDVIVIMLYPPFAISVVKMITVFVFCNASLILNYTMTVAGTNFMIQT
jgi:hypothetical protein